MITEDSPDAQRLVRTAHNIGFVLVAQARQHYSIEQLDKVIHDFDTTDPTWGAVAETFIDAITSKLAEANR